MIELFNANTVISLLLALFFLAGAAVNFLAPESIKNDYKRWKYPRGFQYLTALVEFIAAALLIVPNVALFGAALGAATMAIAAMTVVFHKEYNRAIAPSLAMLASIYCFIILF